MTWPAGANVLHGSDGLFKWYPNETEFGGALASPNGILMEISTENIKQTQTKIKYPGINRGKQMRRPRYGNKAVAGSPQIVANLPILGYLFQAHHGVPSAKTAASVWSRFQGSGLNDATPGGTYSGLAFKVFLLEVQSEGTPDTFRWSNNGGITWTENVAMTGAAQILEDSVSVTWGADTGHNAGDRVWIYCHAQTAFVYQPSLVVPPSGKIERSWDTLDPERHLVYNGCRPNKIRMQIGPEWNGLVTVDFLGRVMDAPATSPLTGSPLVLTAPWLAGPDAMVLTAGQESYRIEQLDITFDMGITPGRYPIMKGGSIVRSLVPGVKMISGSLTIAMEDAQYLDESVAHTPVDLGYRLIDTEATPGVFDFRATEVDLEPTQEEMKDGDVVNTFNFEAFYEESHLGATCQVIVENGLASTAYDGPP